MSNFDQIAKTHYLNLRGRLATAEAKMEAATTDAQMVKAMNEVSRLRQQVKAAAVNV